jgi:hypothetical protein
MDLAKASLTLVHVWQPLVYSSAPEAMIPGDVIQAMADDAERTLADREASVKAAGIETVKSTMVIR